MRTNPESDYHTDLFLLDRVHMLVELLSRVVLSFAWAILCDAFGGVLYALRIGGSITFTTDPIDRRLLGASVATSHITRSLYTLFVQIVAGREFQTCGKCDDPWSKQRHLNL